MRDSVVSAEDACGLLLAEGAVPADDAACLVFAGPDQLDMLAQTEAMVGDSRLLLLFNPQWRRPSDFARADRPRADRLFFERGYEVRARAANAAKARSGRLTGPVSRISGACTV